MRSTFGLSRLPIRMVSGFAFHADKPHCHRHSLVYNCPRERTQLSRLYNCYLTRGNALDVGKCRLPRHERTFVPVNGGNLFAAS